ncbi:MAG: hypothetical protein R2932_30855 [Caldilineaceae bacterium]
MSDCGRRIYLLAATALGAAFRFAVTSDYRAPSSVIVGEVLWLLPCWLPGIALAAALSRCPMAGGTAKAVAVGLVALVLAAGSVCLFDLPHSLRRRCARFAPDGARSVAGRRCGDLLRRWSAAGSLWRRPPPAGADPGALPGSALRGLCSVTAGNRIDRFLGGAGLITLLLLVFFAWRLGHRTLLRTTLIMTASAGRLMRNVGGGYALFARSKS